MQEQPFSQKASGAFFAILYLFKAKSKNKSRRMTTLKSLTLRKYCKIESFITSGKYYVFVWTCHNQNQKSRLSNRNQSLIDLRSNSFWVKAGFKKVARRFKRYGSF